MDLRRNPVTGTLHLGSCPRADKVTIPYRYANSIPDKAALSAQTLIYTKMHVCKDCLPGVCKCKNCNMKGTDGKRSLLYFRG